MSHSISYSECPICFATFSSSVIASHAATCTGSSKKTSSTSNKSPKPDVKSFFAPNRKRKDEANLCNENDQSKKAKTEQSQKNDSKNSFSSKSHPESSAKPLLAATPLQTQAANAKQDRQRHIPLAEQMRPVNLDEYCGQEEVAGRDGFWRSLIVSGKIPSMILWGPPGCGKTSLANVIAARCRAEPNKFRFVSLSACTSGVADVKDAVAKAKNELSLVNRQTVLFIDEVHRFNKLQQDAFLPHVENGTLALIGATTENPSFSLNSALLSRCRVIVLKKLSQDSIRKILDRALKAKNVSITKTGSSPVLGLSIEESAIEYLSNISDGDARTALNCLEIALSKHQSDTCDSSNSVIDVDQIKSGLRRAHLLYDRKGDEHFHCASALQKSIRGSNDNAALYWTMRMLEGGEDPMFIARRLVRMASEDVGLGDPTAMGMAVAAMQGCQMIGKPECNVLLAQCAVYLARAKKSHEVNHAMERVIDSIKKCDGNLPAVPLHLRNATTRLAKDMGYAQGYSYDLEKVQSIEYMPEGMETVNFFKN